MRRLVLLIAVISGCASATEDDVLSTRPDSGTPDTNSDDTGPAMDASPETLPKCPSTATCDPSDAPKTMACGNCGTLTTICDPETCTWMPGSCKDEGECAPDSVDTADCTGPGEKKTRTCDAACKWSAYSTCALPTGWTPMSPPPTGFAARSNAITGWTGSELVIWSGRGPVDATKTGVLKDGAAYDPLTDKWRTIAAAPAELANGRELAAVAVHGSKLFIWGGQDGVVYSNAAAIYDAATDTWKVTSASPLSARTQASAVWSTATNEFLVWNGDVPEGAHYDPASDKWTPMSAAPIGRRVGQNAVWTGSKMIIWSGCPGGVSCINDGAAYDPSTKTWTKLADAPAALDGRYGFADVYGDGAMIVWGGYGGTGEKTTGARYDVATDKWTMISPLDASVLANAGRESMAYWYDAGKLFVFGGSSGAFGANGGAVWSAATDTWAALPTKDQPLGRIEPAFAWTGKQAIVWGGTQFRFKADAYYKDGAVFRP